MVWFHPVCESLGMLGPQWEIINWGRFQFASQLIPLKYQHVFFTPPPFAIQIQTPRAARSYFKSRDIFIYVWLLYLVHFNNVNEHFIITKLLYIYCFLHVDWVHGGKKHCFHIHLEIQLSVQRQAILKCNSVVLFPRCVLWVHWERVDLCSGVSRFLVGCSCREASWVMDSPVIWTRLACLGTWCGKKVSI